MRHCFGWILLGAVAACGATGDDEVAREGNTGNVALAAKPGAHFLGTPTCMQVGETLTCSGSVAGLGNQAVTVELLVNRICTNRGTNQPPGQVKGTTGPIQPENGRIDFTVTVSSGCPDQMTTTYQSPATIVILRDHTEVFTGLIYF